MSIVYLKVYISSCGYSLEAPHLGVLMNTNNIGIFDFCYFDFAYLE